MYLVIMMAIGAIGMTLSSDWQGWLGLLLLAGFLFIGGIIKEK